MYIQRTRVWEVKYVEIWTNESGKGGWITDLIFFRYSDIGLQEGASWSKCQITCQESRLSDVLSKHIEAYVHDPPKYLQSHSETAYLLWIIDLLICVGMLCYWDRGGDESGRSIGDGDDFLTNAQLWMLLLPPPASGLRSSGLPDPEWYGKWCHFAQKFVFALDLCIITVFKSVCIKLLFSRF